MMRLCLALALFLGVFVIATIPGSASTPTVVDDAEAQRSAELLVLLRAGFRDRLRKPGAAPDKGVETQVGVGESVYREFAVEEAVRARLTEASKVSNKLTVPAGTELLPERVDWQQGFGTVAWCSSSHRYGRSALLGRPQQAVCFSDRTWDGVFEYAAIRGYGTLTLSPTGYRYEVFTVPISGEAPTGFKRELVYQGAAGGTLRLLYREYANDLARPAFSQEATYDLSPSGPTLATFKGAQIEVLEAGNAGIRYRVLRGFTAD